MPWLREVGADSVEDDDALRLCKLRQTGRQGLRSARMLGHGRRPDVRGLQGALQLLHITPPALMHVPRWASAGCTKLEGRSSSGVPGFALATCEPALTSDPFKGQSNPHAVSWA